MRDDLQTLSSVRKSLGTSLTESALIVVVDVLRDTLVRLDKLEKNLDLLTVKVGEMENHLKQVAEGAALAQTWLTRY